MLCWINFSVIRKENKLRLNFFHLPFAYWNSTLFLARLFTQGPEKSLELVNKVQFTHLLWPQFICTLQPVVVSKAKRKSQNRENEPVHTV